MRPGESPKADAERHERIVRAVELRKQGKSYPAIATELGCAISTAFQYVWTHFSELDQMATEQLEGVRKLELARLDKMLERLWVIIDAKPEVVVSEEDGQLPSLMVADCNGDAIKAIIAATKLMERRAKLLGLDAPAKVETKTTPAEPANDAELLAQLEEATAKVKARLTEQKEQRH